MDFLMLQILSLSSEFYIGFVIDEEYRHIFGFYNYFRLHEILQTAFQVPINFQKKLV